jgi:hypothetical protein
MSALGQPGWFERVPIILGFPHEWTFSDANAVGFSKRSIHLASYCLTGCLTDPTGKSPISLSSPFRKNILVFRTPKSGL